jgi:hypothetical protein
MTGKVACLLLLLNVISGAVVAGNSGESDCQLIPHAVRAITPDPSGNFTINTTNLEMVMKGVPPNTKVAIISIAGVFRNGKSYLMNFFPQYLAARMKSDAAIEPQADEQALQTLIMHDNHPWLRDTCPNTGFTFNNGQKRVTIGLDIWPRAFLIRHGNEDLAVVLIDSQGLFDKKENLDMNSHLFTLVSLISSSLILNEEKKLNSEKIAKLTNFLQYASYSPDGTHGENSTKMFQRMTYVLRDFNYDPAGWDGGQENLMNFLYGSHFTKDEKIVTDALVNGFEQIDAFGLCFPGRAMLAKNFTGSLKLLDEYFIHQVETLIVNITEAARPRLFMNEKITASGFAEFIKQVVDRVNGRDKPSDFFERMRLFQIEAVRTKIEERMNYFKKKFKDHVGDKSLPLWCNKADVIADLRAFSSELTRTTLAAFNESPDANKTYTATKETGFVTAIQQLEADIRGWTLESIDDEATRIDDTIIRTYMEIRERIATTEIVKFEQDVDRRKRSQNWIYEESKSMKDVFDSLRREREL